MAKPKFTIDEARELRRRYEEGETTTSLAKEFNAGDCCISSWIQKAGGSIRSNSESKRKNYFNEDFFNNIDNEYKAYWLGFFLADGYIGKYLGKYRNFWCTLSDKDHEHLSKFLDHIDATYTVSRYMRDGHNKCRICLTSMPFVQNLIDIGWIDFKKDGSTRILEQVPDNLVNHFIRGFFDGDGSIVRRQRKDRPSISYSVVIVAPYEHRQFLDKIRGIIVGKCEVTDKSLKKRDSTYACHWNGNLQVKRIGDWMYAGANVYLERKRKRFDDIDGIVKFIWPDDNRFSCSHTPKQIRDLPIERRKAVINNFCQLALNSDWKPFKYDDDALLADWRAVKIYNNQLYCVYDDNEFIGFRLNTGGGSESPGKKIVLHYQPHFWDVKTSGQPIPGQWNNKSVVRRAAKALLTTGSSITLRRYIRELRYAGAGVTSHFHPNFAAAIIQSLAPDTKSWFDPCMGWGGRLIASELLNINYEGCDPQPDTFRGLKDIKMFIGSNAVIHNIKIQDYLFRNRFDLGFTSPPFFNKERYGGSEQSHKEFRGYNTWFTRFLCPMVDKMLSNCAVVILHVDERIMESLDKVYEFERYPLYLQKNPGGPVGTESIIKFK